MKPKVRAAPKAAPSGQELELLMRKARGEGGGDDEGPPEPSADAMPGLGFRKCAAQPLPEAGGIRNPFLLGIKEPFLIPPAGRHHLVGVCLETLGPLPLSHQYTFAFGDCC